MSVIAVKITNGVATVAADSIVVSGYTQSKEKSVKLKYINNMIIGGVGSAEELALFMLFCKTRTPKSSDDDGILEFISGFMDWKYKKISKSDIDNDYVIVFEKKCFIARGFFIKEVSHFAAIGAGMDYALTALHLGKSAHDAVAVACDLCIYCERPVNVLVCRSSETNNN